MKSINLAMLLLVVSFATTTSAQNLTELHSLNKYGRDQNQDPTRNYCLDFLTGVSGKRSDPCDLRYGSLYVGDDWDWFQSSGHRDSRGLIKDLGRLNWESQLKVPFIKPLPKLLPSERRTITVNADGADGADGAPGAPGRPGADALIDPITGYERRQKPSTTPPPNTYDPIPNTKKKHDGVPKVDPIFVKAIVGHMYAMRVLDEKNDFYVLFRVEEIKKGDSVVVSWKLVDAPIEPANKQ